MKTTSWISALILGSVIGVIATGPALLGYYQYGMLENGPWRTHQDFGKRDANPYVRAIVTVGGLFALRQEEAIYWSVGELHDEPLSNRCHYVLEGRDLNTDWWSLTVYDGDGYLIPNHEARYSYTNHNVARAPNGRWAIHVAPGRQEINWLPSRKPDELPEAQLPGRLFSLLPGANDRIRLMLRLYQPDNVHLANPANAPLPTIRKEGCV